MKRMLALILALVMTMALVSCGGDKPSSTPSSTPSASTEPSKPSEPSQPADPKPTEPEKPAEPKVANIYKSNEAVTIFPQASNSSYDSDVMDRIFTTLYGYLPVDGKAVLSPILADGEPVDVNGDGKTWNIKINKDAKWANGDPINADTFVFTLQIALDPKAYYTTGATTAKNTIEIVKAAAYYGQGKEGATPVAWEEVGIKKVDEYTLQIQVVNAVSALDVMRHLNYKSMMPVHEGMYKQCTAADGSTTYGTTKDTVIACGPYILTEWVLEALHTYEKNENYIRADLVKIDKVNEPVVSDKNTRLQMFEAGELDYYGMSTEARKKYEDDPRVVAYPSRTVNTIEILDTNPDNPILSSYNFRLALYYGIDRAAVTKVVSGEPTLSTIPPTAGGMTDGTLYKTVAYANNTYLAQDTMGYDPVLAKQYFDKALAEMNMTSVEVDLLVTDGYAKVAEYLQEAWPQIFGEGKITVTINVQTGNAINEIRGGWQTNPTAYDLCFYGAGAKASDYNPIKGSAAFNTVREKRNAPHYNDEAAALFTQGSNATDPEEMYRIAMEYEKALQKTMTAIPVYHGASYIMFTDHYIPAVDPENYEVNGGWLHNYADIVK